MPLFWPRVSLTKRTGLKQLFEFCLVPYRSSVTFFLCVTPIERFQIITERTVRVSCDLFEDTASGLHCME
jgi:hypothetical protein